MAALRALPGRRNVGEEFVVPRSGGPPEGGTTIIFFAGTLALALLWAIGQVARDATWLTGMCFYIPSVVVGAALVVWTLVCGVRRRCRLAVLTAGLALAPLGVVLFAENRFGAEPGRPATDGELRLVHWNVAHRLSTGAQQVLRDQHADIYVLSEIPDVRTVEEFRATLGPEYQAQIFANLAVIATGTIRTDGWLINCSSTSVQSVTWERNGRTLRLLVVDLPSSIQIHRDPLLREINALIERHQPDLVVGDFNAPRRSRALASLPDGYRHAYDTAGSGWGYTWPVPVPMYALDHCLHSSRIVLVHYSLHSSIHSDHRLQIMDFCLGTRDRRVGKIDDYSRVKGQWSKLPRPK
jgi:endonuclease/exonuclease/phosphatase (EEP) superfamily protein YafD